MFLLRDHAFKSFLIFTKRNVDVNELYDINESKYYLLEYTLFPAGIFDGNNAYISYFQNESFVPFEIFKRE